MHGEKSWCLRGAAGALLLASFLLGSCSPAQVSREAGIESMYADIIGSWELDLTDAGQGKLVAEVVMRDGALWILREMANPGKMVPVAGNAYEFRVKDGRSVWEIAFVRDAEGRYHGLRGVNRDAGINAIGRKLPDVETTEIGLEERYADIIGKWELDLRDAGMGLLPVEFYTDGKALWMHPEMDEPGKMIVLLGEEWTFRVTDSGSVWVFEFMRDGNGRYHRCRVVNGSAGIDTIGWKRRQDNAIESTDGR